MIGHIGINVPDLKAAKAYYDEIMPLLDYDQFFATEGEFSYLPANGKRGAYLFFYPGQSTKPYSKDATSLQHLAFVVPTRTAVGAVHERVMALGSEVLHQPQEFPQYPAPYFATFWLDPFGLLLEAVCHHDRD